MATLSKVVRQVLEADGSCQGGQRLGRAACSRWFERVQPVSKDDLLLLYARKWNVELDLRNLSVKHTVQLRTEWGSPGLTTEDRQRLFTSIAQRRVGHRPGRIEPRMRKRRPRPYPWLKVSRAHARHQVQEHGHAWETN